MSPRGPYLRSVSCHPGPCNPSWLMSPGLCRSTREQLRLSQPAAAGSRTSVSQTSAKQSGTVDCAMRPSHLAMQATKIGRDSKDKPTLPAGKTQRSAFALLEKFPPLLSGVRVLVDDVAAEPVSSEMSMLIGKEHALAKHKTATACSHMDTHFVLARMDTSNALLIAAVRAFCSHHPLEITPDAIFSTIMAGMSAHVNANPEKLRSSFVSHEGKKVLAVRDDSLVMGSWENRWDRPVAELGELVMENLSNDNACKVLSACFSTTGPAQTAAHTMTFMDVVKAYFDYYCLTDCGIPHIDIAGCKEDWEKLAALISPLLLELGLGQWNDQLQGILGHFVAAFEGMAEQNREFWQGIFKYNGPAGSGDVANVTSWLSQLFPYLVSRRLGQQVSPGVNIPGGIKACSYEFFEAFGAEHGALSNEPDPCCIALSRFPSNTTSTPFVWNYYGAEHQMELVAGIIGVTIGDSGALKPEVGWLVAHAKEEQQPE